MRNPNVCRSCAAPIRWAVAASSGRTMPLDAAPTLDGNIELVDHGPRWEGGEMERRAVVFAGLELHAARERGAVLYLSHFVTCPNRDEHRRAS